MSHKRPANIALDLIWVALLLCCEIFFDSPTWMRISMSFIAGMGAAFCMEDYRQYLDQELERLRSLSRSDGA